MPAPNLEEVEWAISELEKEESSFPVYSKLADLYTVRKEMIGTSPQPPRVERSLYSGSTHSDGIGKYGDSDFLRLISGKDQEKVWGIIDDLMDTLRVVNPKVYNRIMTEINDI